MRIEANIYMDIHIYGSHTHIHIMEIFLPFIQIITCNAPFQHLDFST